MEVHVCNLLVRVVDGKAHDPRRVFDEENDGVGAHLEGWLDRILIHHDEDPLLFLALSYLFPSRHALSLYLGHDDFR